MVLCIRISRRWVTKKRIVLSYFLPLHFDPSLRRPSFRMTVIVLFICRKVSVKASLCLNCNPGLIFSAKPLNSQNDKANHHQQKQYPYQTPFKTGEERSGMNHALT